MSDRAERLRLATEQLHEALGVIEEDAGAAQYEGEVKMVAMRYGVDWTTSFAAQLHSLGGERDRLRGVVEALAAADPVDTSFTFPRCWHCGGESPNEHATAERWLEHEDDCNWAAAVAALEGETP